MIDRGYITVKHIKKLRPGPLDVLGDLSQFKDDLMKKSLCLMLHNYVEEHREHLDWKPVDQSTESPLTLQQSMHRCVDEILCNPRGEITGEVDMDYTATVDGTLLTANIDILIDKSHIIQLIYCDSDTDTINIEQDQRNYLLHSIIMRYLAGTEVTQYMTHINLASGTVHCWEISASFFTTGEAEKFITRSLQRFQKRVKDHYEYH